MEFLSMDASSIPTLSAVSALALINIAIMRVTLSSVKAEMEKLEKKLEILHTHLLKVSVIEARLGHLEKDINKTHERVNVIEQRFLFKSTE